jgi:hypothetical protein
MPTESTSRNILNMLVYFTQPMFCFSWAYTSMVILISSRLIFTFSDVSDAGKNAIAAVLITFLGLVLLRTIGGLVYKKISHNHHIPINQEILESLDAQDRASVSEVLADYNVLHRRRVVEIDQDYAMGSKAAKAFLLIAKLSNIPTRVGGRVRIVSIPINQLTPNQQSALPPSNAADAP